jgi:hypothetical protein
MANVPFENFSNLNTLKLVGVAIDDDTFSVLSKLPLKYISLHVCKIIKDHLLKLLEYWISLEEIELLSCTFNPVLLQLPPYLKRFKLDCYRSYEINASLCIQLQNL